jgi:hypothetical protein
MGKGNGKALALNTPIATPSGWSTMADLAIGDEVFGPDGRRLSVLAATEPMLNRQCFSVNRKNIFRSACILLIQILVTNSFQPSDFRDDSGAHI